MNAVLTSIQPKWVEKIASGQKTIEVRKTAPKQVPFKGYIYCTKSGENIYGDSNVFVTDSLKRLRKSHTMGDAFEKQSGLTLWNGKVIGEFVCDGIAEFESEFHDDNSTEQLRRVWYDEDDGERDAELFAEDGEPNYLCTAACLTWYELKNYVGIGDRTFYGWHISDLKIYDKPKELSEFKTPPCEKSEKSCANCKWLVKVNTPERYECECYVEDGRPITRAPQSWQYVEELEDEN